MTVRPGPRVLYSFPHRIGAGRICTTAWHQVAASAAAGVAVEAHVASVTRPLPPPVQVRETLARGRARLPYRVVGDQRMFRLHDEIVARRLERRAEQFDLVHLWPSGALKTLETARARGVKTVLERPSVHTRYFYDVVARESERLGIEYAPNREHAFGPAVLAREEREFELADYLLCPSDFVRQTFRAAGVPDEKLLLHFYGFDATAFYPREDGTDVDRPFTMLFASHASVVKGLHFALEAWLASPAHERGRFVVAGEIVPEYEKVLLPMLEHPSVTVLGHSTRVAELMREADIFVLPSIAEGSALVCSEALASGAVPVVSAATNSHCRHMENALVHSVGDVATLTEHITLLFEDRDLLRRLREQALVSAHTISWAKAGERLADLYADVAGSPVASRRLPLATVSGNHT
jgi:glycosyltransferase involved in cell wall biosynthesis